MTFRKKPCTNIFSTCLANKTTTVYFFYFFYFFFMGRGWCRLRTCIAYAVLSVVCSNINTYWYEIRVSKYSVNSFNNTFWPVKITIFFLSMYLQDMYQITAYFWFLHWLFDIICRHLLCIPHITHNFFIWSSMCMATNW